MLSMNEIRALPTSQVVARLERIRPMFDGKPVLNGLQGYPYCVFALTDYTPPLDPRFVEDMADVLVKIGNFPSEHLILSEADRGGGPLAHAVAIRTESAYVLANWYPLEMNGQIEVKANVGFSGVGSIFLNGVTVGNQVVLVDDLLSTGGTALALIKAVRKSGAEIKQALFVAEKIGFGGRSLLEAHGVEVKSLISVSVTGQFSSAVINSLG